MNPPDERPSILPHVRAARLPPRLSRFSAGLHIPGHEQNLCSGTGGAGPVRCVARGGSGAARHDVRPGDAASLGRGRVRRLARREQVRPGSGLERLVRRRGVQRLGRALPDAARQDRRRSLDDVQGRVFSETFFAPPPAPPFTCHPPPCRRSTRRLRTRSANTNSGGRPLARRSRTSSSKTDGCIRSWAWASRACARRSSCRRSSVPTGGRSRTGSDSRDTGRGTRPGRSSTGGLKFYVSERGFIRTDVLTTLSSNGAESAVWRIGVGVDF